MKNRIQTSGSDIPAKDEMYSTVKTIWKEEGIRGFYRGGLTLVIRGFPVNALIFVIYSNVMTELEKLH